MTWYGRIERPRSGRKVIFPPCGGSQVLVPTPMAQGCISARPLVLTASDPTTKAHSCMSGVSASAWTWGTYTHPPGAKLHGHGGLRRPGMGHPRAPDGRSTLDVGPSRVSARSSSSSWDTRGRCGGLRRGWNVPGVWPRASAGGSGPLSV